MDSDLKEYIHVKCSAGDHHTVSLLLHQNPEKVHATSGTLGVPPLFFACRYGHARVVRILIEFGADVDASSNGWSPLHEACHGQHVEVVNVLIGRGVNVNVATSYSGLTPLMQAARNGCMRLCEALLAAGADTWRENVDGKKAMDLTRSDGCNALLARHMRVGLVEKHRLFFFWGKLPDDVFRRVLAYV